MIVDLARAPADEAGQGEDGGEQEHERENGERRVMADNQPAP